MRCDSELVIALLRAANGVLGGTVSRPLRRSVNASLTVGIGFVSEFDSSHGAC